MSTWFVRHPGENDLALFAGGELGPLARWRIEGHLHGCSTCRQAVSEFFELRSKVMDLGELPHLDWPEMAERIQGAVARERSRAPTGPLWRPVWSMAAALVLLVAAGLYVAQHHAPPGPVLDASATGIELRMGTDQVLTFTNAAQVETPVQWRVSADTASARYLDKDTGNITITNVYAQ